MLLAFPGTKQRNKLSLSIAQWLKRHYCKDYGVRFFLSLPIRQRDVVGYRRLFGTAGWLFCNTLRMVLMRSPVSIGFARYPSIPACKHRSWSSFMACAVMA